MYGTKNVRDPSIMEEGWGDSVSKKNMGWQT